LLLRRRVRLLLNQPPLQSVSQEAFALEILASHHDAARVWLGIALYFDCFSDCVWSDASFNLGARQSYD